jgi:hypothetical protein
LCHAPLWGRRSRGRTGRSRRSSAIIFFVDARPEGRSPHHREPTGQSPRTHLPEIHAILGHASLKTTRFKDPRAGFPGNPYAEGVPQPSPGSRSAPWERRIAAPSRFPPSAAHPNGVPRPAAPARLGSEWWNPVGGQAMRETETQGAPAATLGLAVERLRRTEIGRTKVVISEKSLSWGVVLRTTSQRLASKLRNRSHDFEESMDCASASEVEPVAVRTKPASPGIEIAKSKPRLSGLDRSCGRPEVRP